MSTEPVTATTTVAVTPSAFNLTSVYHAAIAFLGWALPLVTSFEAGTATSVTIPSRTIDLTKFDLGKVSIAGSVTLQKQP